MATPADPIVALLYDNDGYVEVKPGTKAADKRNTLGLLGRQVAGREFLDAFLTFGSWDFLVALVYNQPSIDTLVAYSKSHPTAHLKKRHIELVHGGAFHQRFFPTPPARLIYVPSPPQPSFAWARYHGCPHAYSLCGVTHTLCSPEVLKIFAEMVTGPFEDYDALICTSRAAVEMIRATANAYCDYLRDRLGGNPTWRVRLEHIPLGVDPLKFHVPSPDERQLQRRNFGVHDDEIVVLYVGRLSFHSKAHPFPMYVGVAEAARRTGKKVHLMISGWAGNESIQKAFHDGAKEFAPGVRVSFVSSHEPERRYAIWHAADIFTTLSDNLQETFGLVVTQAMACGLPVVGTDWDGFRDLIVEGETGFLVPTYMVYDSTRDATSRLMGVNELDYDHFVGECSQTVTVDLADAASAYERLIADADLRRRMGEAGRTRVLERFTWERVIGEYERLWREQEAARKEHAAHVADVPRATPPGPAFFPAPEHSFAWYPTRILRGDTRVKTTEALSRLPQFLSNPLTNHSGAYRCQQAQVIQTALAAAKSGCAIADLDAAFEKVNVPLVKARATTAWLLKYGLLVLNDHETVQ